MRTTAAFLTLAATVSAMGAASPAFAASEGAQASPLVPHAPPADIVGTSIFFGALVTIVLLAQVFATRRERIRQDTLRAMVDRGMEIPSGLIGGRARARQTCGAGWCSWALGWASRSRSPSST